MSAVVYGCPYAHMDQSTLLTIMAVAVSLSAIAMIFGACFLFGIYKATAAVRDRVLLTIPKVESLIPKVEAILPKIDALVPKIDALLETSRETVTESKAMITEGKAMLVDIRQKSNLLLDSGHKQMKSLDSLVTDVTDRTRRQAEHAEMIVSETLEKAEQTVGLVHKGILKPIRGVTGMAAGVSAAFQVLFRAGRANPNEATIDEEMFI
jgi:hypothetical protein